MVEVAQPRRLVQVGEGKPGDSEGRIRCGSRGHFQLLIICDWLWYDRLQTAMTITLNGDSRHLPQPLSVSALLAQLEIDARRVAVELNLAVVKKAAYDSSVINDGDEVEIVNFVGGG
jgi:thiamine biosynthesis protein ThiS